MHLATVKSIPSDTFNTLQKKSKELDEQDYDKGTGRMTLLFTFAKFRQEERDWLKQNHERNNGIQLVFYKKKTNKPTLEQNEKLGMK